MKREGSEEGGKTIRGEGGEKKESREKESVVSLRRGGKGVRESRVRKVKRSKREEKEGRIGEWGRKECRREEGKEQEGSLKMGFWNVTGVKGKQEGFWERTKEWDVVGLVETWLEQKEWEKMKNKMLKEFNWRIQGAKKERVGRKGRAIGGIMMVRKGLEGEEEWVEEEGLMIREVRWKKEKWRLATVYVSGNLDKIMGKIKSVKEKEGREERWIVGGNFNARTEEKGALEDGKEGVKRICDRLYLSVNKKN